MRLQRAFYLSATAVVAFALLTVSLVVAATSLGKSSHAGSQLVFEQGGSVMAMTPQGKNLHRVVKFPGHVVDIAAARNGRAIAALSFSGPVSPQGKARTLWLYRKGHGIRRVLPAFNSVAGKDIAISPDGRTLAYGREAEIWTVSVSGRGNRLLTKGGGIADDPAFAPGGRMLLVRRNDSGSRAYLWKPSGAERVLTPVGRYASEPVFVPGAGSKPPQVAYISLRPNTSSFQIEIRSLDGSGAYGIAAVTDPRFLFDIALSPSARSLAYGEGIGENPPTRRYFSNTIRVSGENAMVAREGKVGRRPAGLEWTNVP